jgi:hypothetical protein
MAWGCPRWRSTEPCTTKTPRPPWRDSSPRQGSGSARVIASAYATLAQALAVKEKREHLTGLALHVYRCDYADEPDGHWHLSSHEPTEAQQARRIARSQAYAQELDAELAGYDKALREIRDARDRLIRAIVQRTKRINRARSVATLNALYAEQRDDFTRLIELWDEGLDTALAREQLLICVRELATADTPMTLACYQQVGAKLKDAVAEAERVRERNAAFFAERLASLEAQQADDAQWIREQINQRYALPAMPWRAS